MGHDETIEVPLCQQLLELLLSRWMVHSCLSSAGNTTAPAEACRLPRWLKLGNLYRVRSLLVGPKNVRVTLAMANGVSMDHIGFRSRTGTKRNYLLSLLRRHHKVLIPQSSCPADTVHRDHDDGQINRVSGLV